MPGVGYVSRIEMHHDTDVAHDAYGVRRLVRGPRGCHVTIVVEIDGWEGGRPNVLLMLAEETVGVRVVPEVIVGGPPPKKKRQRKERPAPSSPCLPLPAPRDPSRWDFLEVDDD